MSLNFTPEQEAIFDFVRNGKDHGIIDAVAGAGKTTTIMECARFVVDRSDILFCAFNKSIAIEITQKFNERGLTEVRVETIHALGWRILQSNNRSGEKLQLEERKYYELLDSPEIRAKLEAYYTQIIIINGINLDSQNDWQQFAVKNIVKDINRRLLDINEKFRCTLTKENFEDFKDLVLHFGIFNSIEINKNDFIKELSYYYECHKILLESGNEFSRRTMKIDFTDMIYLPFIWNLAPVTKYGFLFIDECQDLSKAQLYVAAKYGRRDGRILAVGDPHQSIYGFTGADINSFNRIKEYTNAKLLPLTICFRCPRKMIDLAKYFRSDIKGNKEQEGTITSINFNDILDLAKSGDLIISRTKAPLVILVFDFIDRDQKVQIHKDEVKDIINELKNIFKQQELHLIIDNLPDKFEKLKKDVLKRWDWIISRNAERIVDLAERNIYIGNEKSYLKKKLEFLHKKYEQWKSECPTLLNILERIKDFISAAENAVKLSTIHRAKGLENHRIFIVNYDELPLRRPDQKDWEIVQERNLKYVAVTRALQELFLIEARKMNEMILEGSLFDTLPFD